MSSLDLWRGEFGTEYTERQEYVDPAPTLRELLTCGEFRSVLEVGCNRGDNLAAFPGIWREGVEPNEFARMRAKRRYVVTNGHAGALPHPDGCFDLVFTAGVLIHINPYHLDRAMYEIHRVSRRYILSIEYEAPLEVGVEYRGIPDGIWKRDYWQEWSSRHPGLNLVQYWPEVDFDGTAFEGCSAWLMDKRPPVSGP